jgi:hypothetical protein
VDVLAAAPIMLLRDDVYYRNLLYEFTMVVIQKVPGDQVWVRKLRQVYEGMFVDTVLAWELSLTLQ